MASISVTNVNFSYQYFSSVSGGLLSSDAGLKSESALSEINFEAKDGDRYALFGVNGAGKSTFLKLISGVIAPTSGRVDKVGEVYSFFGRNVGVMPQLSGHENLIIRGLLLNVPDKILKEKIDAICQFIDLKDAIHRPVSSYSQGMKARLTFGMLMFVDADILLIDEGLAAGDQFFIEKAHAFIDQLLGNSRIMLFASHSIPLLRKFCNKALLLKDGQIKLNDRFETVCSAYKELKNEK